MDYETLLAFFPDRLSGLILAEDISDVMISEDGRVFVDRDGTVRLEVGITIEPGALVSAVQNVARRLGKDIDDSRPFLDSRLPDGSRVSAFYANRSMYVTIRKFNRWFSLEDLDRSGCCPLAVSSLVVEKLIGKGPAGKANILVSGGPGSGKTTLSKALVDRLPETDRLVVIEEPREMPVRQSATVHLEASAGDESRAEVTIGQLVAFSLRQRPDRIIIGEVREPQAAYQFIQALNTGHSGSLSTIHADSASDALTRLTDLYLASQANLSHDFATRRILSSIHFVIHITREGARRRVTEVVQVVDKKKLDRIYPV